MGSFRLVQPKKVNCGGVDAGLKSSFHLIPLALTTVLLYVNLRELYWFPASGIQVGKVQFSANDILNTLQVAAKIYEILVVASLGTITFDAFKRQLVNDGIPLGLLTGPYRVSDVKYILSKRFWVAAPQTMCLAVLLLICVLLCTLMGPASAILLVPKTGWFPLTKAFSKVDMPILMSYPNDMWPEVFNETLIYGGGCIGQSASYIPECPASGLYQLASWARGWSHSGIPDNITFEDPWNSVSRRLYMQSGNSSGTFVTSLRVMTTSTFGLFQTYFNSHDIGAISSTETYKLSLTRSSTDYQPLVNAKCNVWTHQDFGNVSDVPELYYPSSELNCYSAESTDAKCYRMREKVKKKRLSQRIWSAQDMIYEFDVVGGNNDTHDSVSTLTFAASSPYVHDGHRDMRVFACTYMAHWIPSVSYLDPTNHRSIESNITDLGVFFNESTWRNKPFEAVVGPVIDIQKEWLPYVDLALNDKKNGSKSDSDALMNVKFILNCLHGPSLNISGDSFFFGPGSTSGPHVKEEADFVARMTIEKVTGAIITDAIARTSSHITPGLMKPGASGNGSVEILNLRYTQGIMKKSMDIFPNGTIRTSPKYVVHYNTSFEDEIRGWRAHVVNFDLDPERFGYGYGAPGQAMSFAIVIVCLYVFAVLGNWLLIACCRTKTVVAFDDVQDLINLAWASPATPEMEEQTVETGNAELWKKKVLVGATSSRSLEMDYGKSRQQTKLSRLEKQEEYW